jgi:hypothetical protein
MKPMVRATKREALIYLFLFLLALLPRFLNINTFITWDEPMWTYRSIHFLAALLRGDFRGTFLVGHPGVMTMWSGATGIAIQRLLGSGSATDSEVETAFAWLSDLPNLDPRDAEAMRKLAPFLSAAKLPLAALSAACVMGIYLLARRLFDAKISLLAALLLALDPFHLALSRVLHIDALAANFMILSLLSMLVHLRQYRSRLYLLLSGAFAGIAFLSKSYALFLAPFAGLLLAVAYPSATPSTGSGQRLRTGLAKERDFRQAILLLLRSFATWCLVAALIVFLLWPAMWVDPLGTIQSVLDTAFGYAATPYATSKFFLGKVVTDPGPWFYPVVLAFRTTPLAMLGLLIALPLLPGSRKAHRGDLAALLAYACLFTILMTLGAKKFDRYMLPVILVLDIVSAWGLLELGKKLKIGNWKLEIGNWTLVIGHWSLVIVLFLLQTGHIFSYHPYYLAYYNPLLGGWRLAPKVLPIGWGEGMDLAADYLNRREDAEELGVATRGVPGFAPLFTGRTSGLTNEGLYSSDYVLVYVSDVQVSSAGTASFYDQRQLERVINIHGLDYVWIYRNTHHLELVAHIENQTKPDDAILLDAPSLFTKYYQGPLPWHLIADARDEAEVVAKLTEISEGRGGHPRRLWYISYPGADPEAWISYQLDTHALLLERLAALSCYLLPTRPAFGITSTKADLDVNFGGRLRLVGYGFTEDSVEYRKKLGVVLRWQAQQEEENYALSLRLMDSSGHPWAQVDEWLLNPSGLPTSAWQAGETSEGRYLLPIPPGIPPGRYLVKAIVYQTDTLEEVAFLDEEGKPANVEYTLGTVLVTSPTVLPSAEELAIPHVLSCDFDGQVELLGYGLSADEVRSGGVLGLTLFWRALRPMEQDHSLLLELRDEAGHTWAETIYPLPNESYPTSHWQPGELLSTPYDLLIDAAVPPGRYRLFANLLDGDGKPLLEESFAISDLSIEGRERHFTVPEIRFPLKANIGHRVALLGYDVSTELDEVLDRTSVESGGVLHLTLYWQALARMGTNYTVFTHLLDAEGRIRGQQDSVPCSGACPTTSWLEGEIIADEYEIAVHPDAPAGEYQIEVGMYDPETMGRLPTFDEAGSPLHDDHILLESTIIVEKGR